MSDREILVVNGDLIGEEAERVKLVLTSMIESSAIKDIMLDVTNMKKFDTLGLKVLMIAQKELMKSKRRLCLRSASPNIYKVLSAMSLVECVELR